MNMFIFENADKVSDKYHEGGGLAVVAADIEHVKQLVEATNGSVRLSDDDIKQVIVYPLKGKHEAKIFAFPDAGCC
jgi:uncharacterized membrane protein YvbJ